MPNIWTHILFCEELVDVTEMATGFNRKDEAYLNLGAQGPDPFFYYNFWPWKAKSPVNDIGLILHTEQCGKFLMNMIKGAKSGSRAIKAYVIGFVTHHILDRNTHPFIHYHAGYEKNKHQQLEIIIDTIMMERFKNLKTWRAPVYKEMDISRKLDYALINMLYQNIKKVYSPIGTPKNYIQASFRDMILALKVLHDPHGWKNSILRSAISSFSHQPVSNNGVDYLNDNEQIWFHPATNEASTKSFLTLYEQARAEGLEILPEIINYWERPFGTDVIENESKLEKLIGNVSYDTGLPLDLNYSNQYARPII
ncbi:zinc dependent phospholipase C family protein [Aquibacillus kalidii]|uniref:zinc dependent phospholipase C family protein n=1 Tax=Aquibacillus kalidii TaxID=2762597 RepID=UPI001644D25E|nr:zinc dependent phospholipase C family protein [Aquibacillus kalidii]